MRYFSTRDKKLDFSFTEIFSRGLAPDGGLFIPSDLKKYTNNELKNLKNLSYVDLATEIISNFCSSDLKKEKLRALVSKAYGNFNTKEVVEIKKVGDIHLLELYHGPTLAFKDIAMQVIGNLYDELNIADKKKVNIVVATSGDTGSAAISALNDKKNINVFVLHPHDKISRTQRKIMTTIGSINIYNIAIRGNFDDCQKIVKEMFSDNNFREKINMSGVNSINWARIICQIVYYFYTYFRLSKKTNFAVPTGNFGDIYAGYMAKKMGLPMGKLIVATNKNDILARAINSGEYKPNEVKATLTPSMDIQISSNFERLLFDVSEQSEKRVITLMNNLNNKGSFSLETKEINVIKDIFDAEAIDDDETIRIIRDFFNNFGSILDPHTATAVGASYKVKNKLPTVVLGTAHPYKFADTVKIAINRNISAPEQIAALPEKKEKFDILDNNLQKVKNYILEKM
jgi:threonine synthase